MGDFQQYITIDEVVAAYLDRSEQSVHKEFKIWHLAFDGIKQLGLDFFFTIKSVKLPINGNLTVNLPSDYLNYSKIGVFNNRSEIIPLSYNDKLTLFDDQQANRQQETEDPTLYNWFSPNSLIFYNYWNGSTFENLYGIPSGAPYLGSFRIDNSAGIILLSENFAYNYIVLEYVSSPSPKQGTYFLPIQFREALMTFIAWKDIQFMPNSRKGNGGDKEMRKRDFYNERRLANARYRPIYLEEAYVWNLENQRLTVKA